jgi:hypothetical protein
MKSEGLLVDAAEMVVRTTKLRVQNMCCPKEAQIVQEELRKFEVRMIIVELWFVSLCVVNSMS